ncbi:helix-turn-helix transcriptional regulator [Nocardia terpenica]|uniref:helix-turn-helix domain-containing protein n=1 Tax=Nocardia terpenica TaxID=455432 RepID=UPI0018951045|nr:helix-turn-helix transcriptional regulator [Nocardia terpenica]MBF6061327.1 helix-turn-helix transcriptional regulator [Nocardia terpenica]MBF6105444.1 helix-turn-helix transcriptional regulator [Nocardia terpenica]MBF6113086.1 helix-turn-helix transcriptional regulator [Nocardia terpenica]MBF6119216.1 helix-turn-helix transcriptional regulator [Nocardia terpenica]MBF6152864.1 helix-turn-helix transcriptional regulator [Nocardia terpenica]
MQTITAGDLLRHWRTTRRLSQLELAGRAETSARHLSFIETGRATPSRQMILHLSDELEIPLRERNRLLLAAGYAPVYAEPALDTPQMAPVRTAMRQILQGHEPFPALAADMHWTMIDANAGIDLFLDGVAADLLTPPVNALRLSLHPEGMAPHIINLAEWRGHLFERLHRQIEITGSTELVDLERELRDYPGGDEAPGLPEPEQAVVPLRMRHNDTELSFLSAMTVFGTPMNVTVAELAIESFFPADAATAAFLHTRHGE